MGNLVGYKYLRTYQLATIIYDLTVEFCKSYLPGTEYLRQRSQMTQAARSGKQNISEGYLEKSLKMYIKLVGVSRGSLGELLEDYEDYARQNKVKVWPKDDGRVAKIRNEKLGKLGKSEGVVIPNLPNNPETAVNFMITIINQANYLLDKQIDSLEEKFIREGGYSENLFKKRLNVKQDNQGLSIKI